MERVGIGLAGSYIPLLRMDRSVIAENWGRGSLGGERSVANNDEDAITMAVEASLNCLQGMDRKAIDGLFLATTSAAYQEKMNSVLVATAVDLRTEISTLDFAHSLRAGTGALLAAFDSVKSGSRQNVLVAAADLRLGYPRSDQEQSFGDGAAAVLVTGEKPLAVFEGSYSISHEMVDIWRNPEDTFVRTSEGRFILSEGFNRVTSQAVKGLLKKYNLEPGDIDRVVIPAPDIRSHGGLIRQLKFEEKTQIQDPLLTNVGHCGTAQALLMLVAAIEAASPGERILLASYADGADAMVFKVTEEAAKKQNQRTLQEYLDRKLSLPSYAKYLSYKGLVETVPGEPFRLIPSTTVTWRDQNSIYRCHGSKCLDCGTIHFPIQRVCQQCDSKDNMEETPIAGLTGEVFTFTLDQLAGRSDDPVVVQTVASMGEGKVRFYGMMTDCVPGEVTVGLPVGLTFRRIYEGAGMHNYFWKLRPLTIGGNK